MPFLRAALLKQKKLQENEPEQEQKTEIPVSVEFEQEQEDLSEINLEQLNRAIDEKIKELEEISEPEVTEEVEEVLEPEEPSENESEIDEIKVEDNEEEKPVEISETEELEEPSEIEEPKQAEEVEEILEPEEPSESESETEEIKVEVDEEEKPVEISDHEDIGEESEPTPEDFQLMYDVTSGERYVDKISTKTEFDKMLDELADISKDLLSWQVEKFAKEYTGKFQGDGERSEADAKKYEAFLGGYITNAAMILYDNNYKDAAINRLEKAKDILEARKKLEDETIAIKNRVEEEDASVDLSDILGLFGDA